MALVVEVGQAGADSESYASVAFATAYHAARGNAAWAALADDGAREQKLRLATDFIEREYSEQWGGYRVGLMQALSWPRYEVPIKDARTPYGALRAYYPYDSVPALLAQACAVLALQAIDGPLSATPVPAVKRKKVGPIDVEMFEPVMPVHPMSAITEMLRPLLAGSDLNIKVVRA
jgi:hypothetical protein